jgi:DNA repair photolyase
MSYTISLSSLNRERNQSLEPNAPSAEERLVVAKQLSRKGIGVTLKIDTIFPELDDSDKNISALLGKGRSAGIRAVTFSYAFYRQRFKRKLIEISLIQKSIAAMSEKQPIASGHGFSLPLAEKAKRITKMAGMATDMGYEIISACECKNRIKNFQKDTPVRLKCHFHDKWF